MNSRTRRKRIEEPALNENPKKNKTPPEKIKEESIMPTGIKLTKSFYDQSSYKLARALLGKLMVHDVDDKLLKCRIVETELYPGGDDKGSVSFNERRTPSNEPVFMDPGTTYVYLTYGMYHCINISSADFGGAVLIRAGEPVSGVENMMDHRLNKLKSSKSLKPHEVSNGPSKFCIAMAIDKLSCNALDISKSNKLWIEDDNYKLEKGIVSSRRIGINRAGQEAVNQLYRFYILGNANVSKRDLEREEYVDDLESQ